MTSLVHITTVPQSFLFLRHQIAFMTSRGIAVAGITSPGPELAQWEAELGIDIHPVSMPRNITPLQDLQALARLTATLRTLAPDILHAHTPKGGLLGMIAATLAAVPHRVYHMRGLLTATATGPRLAMFTWAERLTCALAHEVICVGHSLREAAIAQRLAPASKLHVMAGGSGQGVDAAGRFDPERPELVTAAQGIRHDHGIPADAFVVGFVGRLVRDKGVVELAQAWTQVVATYPQAHLLVVGPFEQRDAVPKDTIHLLNSTPSIHLAGPTRDPAPYYKAMDLVVLPTYREGFPNVPLEAAAMGLPVVATDIPGCTDAVAHGLTGTLVPPADAPALARALGEYMGNPSKARAHGQAGRQRVLREFSPERISQEIHDLYQALLASKPHEQS